MPDETRVPSKKPAETIEVSETTIVSVEDQPSKIMITNPPSEMVVITRAEWEEIEPDFAAFLLEYLSLCVTIIQRREAGLLKPEVEHE